MPGVRENGNVKQCKIIQTRIHVVLVSIHARLTTTSNLVSVIYLAVCLLTGLHIAFGREDHGLKTGIIQMV